MLEEIIKPSTSDKNIPPIIYYNNSVKIQVKFNGSCLKQDKVAFTPKVIQTFISFIKLIYGQNMLALILH